MKTLKMLLLLLVAITLSGCDSNENKHSAKEWAMLEVENDYHQLDDDGVLLTHDAITQPVSKEIIDEIIADGDSIKILSNNYNHVVEENGLEYYAVFFKHMLIAETSDGLKECTYVSSIAWEDETIFYDYEHAKFSEQQILGHWRTHMELTRKDI